MGIWHLAELAVRCFGKLPRMTVQEHIARKLCEAAGKSVSGYECSCCLKENRKLTCIYWQTFTDEADAAFAAIRDYYLLTPRKKPRI
jgi:hypothetical protein